MALFKSPFCGREERIRRDYKLMKTLCRFTSRQPICNNTPEQQLFRNRTLVTNKGGKITLEDKISTSVDDRLKSVKLNMYKRHSLYHD